MLPIDLTRLAFPALIALALGYIFLYRPQLEAKRKKKERIERVAQGDVVTTAGGIVGHCLAVHGGTIDLQVTGLQSTSLANPIVLLIDRTFISNIQTPESAFISDYATTRPEAAE